LRVSPSLQSVGPFVFLFFDANETQASPEKFRHRTPSPISLWVWTRQSLGKRRQRAHRRRFARPPRTL